MEELEHFQQVHVACQDPGVLCAQNDHSPRRLRPGEEQLEQSDHSYQLSDFTFVHGLRHSAAQQQALRNIARLVFGNYSRRYLGFAGLLFDRFAERAKVLLGTEF